MPLNEGACSRLSGKLPVRNKQDKFRHDFRKTNAIFMISIKNYIFKSLHAKGIRNTAKEAGVDLNVSAT